MRRCLALFSLFKIEVYHSLPEPSDKQMLLLDHRGRLGVVEFGVVRVAPDQAYWLVRSGAGLCGTQNILPGPLDALIEPPRPSAPSICLNGPVREVCARGIGNLDSL